MDQLTEFDVFKAVMQALFLFSLMAYAFIFGTRRIDKDGGDWWAYVWVATPLVIMLLLFTA